MIAIVGEDMDDILYFKTKMSLTTSAKLFGNIEVYLGTLSKESAVVCALGRGNYLSSMLMAMILKQYQPYLVFNVGTCSSFSPQLKQGDLLIADRYYFAGIDFSSDHAGVYGQIPGMNPFYVADSSLNDKIENVAYLLANRYVQRGYLLSGENFYMDEAPVKDIVQKNFLSAASLMAYDTSSAGVALACQMAETTLFTMRVVNYQIGKDEQRLNYVRKGLEAMPTIGKIITKFLIEKESA
jgi:5'-methylthioadenosine/S-adenosylhomocysteine nucleosidase